jgi:hypothetical protein
MADSDYLDAVVKYRTKFPTLASLSTTGSDLAVWKAELAAVEAGTFDSITGTNISLEGGNVGGVLNYQQKHLVRALYAVRAELDSTYTNPYDIPVASPKPFFRMGTVATFNPLP